MSMHSQVSPAIGTHVPAPPEPPVGPLPAVDPALPPCPEPEVPPVAVPPLPELDPALPPLPELEPAVPVLEPPEPPLPSPPPVFDSSPPHAVIMATTGSATKIASGRLHAKHQWADLDAFMASLLQGPPPNQRELWDE